MISNIILPLFPVCLFLSQAVCCEDIKLVELFLVSQRELLLLFWDLHPTRKWVTSFEWISYLYPFFSISSMIVWLWDIFPFSLASHTESIKTSFSLFQSVSYDYFVNPSYLEICLFACFVTFLSFVCLYLSSSYIFDLLCNNFSI